MRRLTHAALLTLLMLLTGLTGCKQQHLVPGLIEAEDYHAYYDTTPGNIGGAYRQQDVDIEPTSDDGGGYNVGWIEAGEWLSYNILVSEAGSYNLSFRVATPNAGRSFNVSLNGSPLLNNVALPNTGSWQSWQTVHAKVNLTAGSHELRLSFPIAGLNLNWIALTRDDGGPGTPPPQPTTPIARHGQLRVCGNQLCNQYQQPVQLRGMSTHGLQWYGWGKCLTSASLDTLAYDWRADVIRLSMYVQEGGYETNPSAFTQQVSRLIDEATQRGMYVIVDWHQLTPGDPNHNLTAAKRFFQDITHLHRNKTNLLYDIANEPNGVSWAGIKHYAEQVIPVIRANQPNAVVLIGTHGWASLGTSDGRSAQDVVANPVNASNIMYGFHFYAASHGQAYRDNLVWAAQRLPLFVTEFGTQTYTGDGANDFVSTQAYFNILDQYKISWANWNYSDDFRSGAVWKTGTCASGDWSTANLKPAGTWIRERIRNR